MQHTTLTKESIETMVYRFYIKVLQDATVAPFFIAKLGDDIQSPIWKEHLALLVSFWSSIALGEGSYSGNPFAPHTQLGELKRETFQVWLRLFAETLDSCYTPEIAQIFKERSEMIAENFMRNLAIG